MNNSQIRDYLSEHAAAAGLDPVTLNGDPGSIQRTLRLVLDGKAKLPLDKVTDTAAAIGCEARPLFRLALTQFYSEDAIGLLESMLATPRRSAAEEV